MFAHADEPLRPPSFQRFSSANGEVAAYATPGSDTRVVSSASGEVLWRIPGWTRLLYLSNDGAHAAVVYDGLNPLPPTFMYLKPYYNDVNKSYFRQLADGEL